MPPDSTNSRSSQLEDRAISLVRSWLSALPFTRPGAAFRPLKRSVRASSAALYCSEGNGCAERPCQQVGPIEHIRFRLRGQLVFDDDREFARPAEGAPTTANTKRPSPAFPCARLRMSMRLTIACSMSGERSRSSAPSGVRGQLSRTTCCIAGRAKHGKPVDRLVGQPRAEEALRQGRCIFRRGRHVAHEPTKGPDAAALGMAGGELGLNEVRTGSSTTLVFVIMSSLRLRTKQPVGSANSKSSSPLKNSKLWPKLTTKNGRR